jgi:hypothetical protein
MRIPGSSIAGTLVAMLVLAVSAPQPAAANYVPGDQEPACERGKEIERALGMHGYRVVVSGGDRGPRDRVVKMQIWQNDEGEWVITERFLHERRTCVVRSGGRLHMMY